MIDADPEKFVALIQQAPLIDVKDIEMPGPFTFNLNPAIRSEMGKQMLRMIEGQAQS